MTLLRAAGFFAALVAAVGCDTSESYVKLVPDGTPFIVATLEASPDTVFFVPQVYVGTLTDMFHPSANGTALASYDLFTDGEHLPSSEIRHPVQWAQVGMKLRQMRMRPDAVTDAAVSIRGPLGQPGEQTVEFASVGRGSYSDVGGRLAVRSGARYRLDVTLPDGRRYTSETRVPAPAEWSLPDTLVVPTHLDESSSPGAYNEVGLLPLSWTPSPDADLTVFGVNHTLEHDRALWGLNPNEHFPAEDRNDFVRQGAQYVIGVTSHPGYHIPTLVWAWPLSRTENEPQKVYIRLYQMNEDLGRYYATEDQEFTVASAEDWWARQNWNEAEVVSSRDTAYFPSISNILRVGADGQALPKAQSDAVGIFGAYSSRYAERWKVPLRSFDPDTLDWAPPAPRPAGPRPPLR